MNAKIQRAAVSALVGLRAPFPYFGSKRLAAGLIEHAMGDIKNLVIPFAGSLGELLGRSEPAAVELVNDSDGLLVNAWRAITYAPEEVAARVDHPVHETTLHAAQALLIARAADLEAHLRDDPSYFDASLAAWWVWGKSCWLGGGWCRTTRAGVVAKSARSRPHLSAGGSGQLARPLSPAKRIVVHGREGVPFLGHGVAKPLRAASLSLSGGGGRPAKGTGVHARQNRERLVEMLQELAARLRWVRMTCGDWTRVLSPAVTTDHGLTGIMLDPPYSLDVRKAGIYRHDDRGVAEEARERARELGPNPMLRIVLAGKGEEHASIERDGWSRFVWRPRDGETLWLSPGCRMPGGQTSLALGDA